MKQYNFRRKTVRTKIFFAGMMLCCGMATTAHAQVREGETITRTQTDTILVTDHKERVITNPFWSNWFVTADAGVNAFWGDCPVGDFGDRLTPQLNVGVGKWVTPGFGLNLELMGFRSKGDKGVQGLYTRGSDTYYDANGNKYWKEKIKWWNIGVNAMFNVTRLITGYEGDNSPRLLNHFIASVGIGATHHYDLPYGSANEWAGQVELQYSRFFSARKDLSLDVKLRGLFYETKYDGVFNHQLFDENISFNVGLTYYFKERGWGRTATNTTIYKQDNYQINKLNEEINQLRKKHAEESVANQKIIERLERVVTFPYLVNFVIDKVNIVNREKINLYWVANMMKATPKQKYLVCGFADKYTGSVKRNVWLAKNRAKNVFKILTEEYGVPVEQLVVDDKGGVDNMYYNDPQLSRSVIIKEIEE